MNTQIITETNFTDLKLRNRGKVRDIYEFDEHLLIVATDRISAFDVIMNEGIPFKGKVLNQISLYWFQLVNNIVKNHIVATDVNDFPEVCHQYKNELQGRSVLVKKAKPFPVECIVRGYLSGSGWNEYQKSKSVCSIPLKDGLQESSKLSETLFTPSTKADIGAHDENISFETMVNLVGISNAEALKKLSISVYEKAANEALLKGIIIADTKMEFGEINEEIIIIDELLTPDSSRFWPKDNYIVGQSQNSYDKQFVRDYLLSIKFNKQPPPPELPAQIIEKTSNLYCEALKKLTGKDVE
ncbi:MAG: phosphoribosylaminoimidazolesuccinocarboxamide synthase [Ignavibacteria bacterium]|nr:phosphoribosylaminoimidazolesuccinocarboxamide synthase [Ignavibacteria bacterium]